MSNEDFTSLSRKMYYELMPTDELEAILQDTFEAGEIDSVCSAETLDTVCRVLAGRNPHPNETIAAYREYREALDRDLPAQNPQKSCAGS